MIVHGRLYKSLAFAISISLILSLFPLPVWGGLRQPGTALAQPLLDVLPSQLASSPDIFAPNEMLLNAGAMQEAADGVQDEPPALAAPLSVSRVQSTYQAAGAISGSLVITFTVTNNMPPAITPVLDPEATVTETIEAVSAFDFSADPNVIRNVLLVDELIPSQATFISASPHPDRSGNSFVGNLGDIPPLGSVTLILSLTVPPSVPDFTDLDTGAIAWGTLQGRAVSASTAPITLAPDGLEDWFACSLDANCHDEYVIKKAAELGNDPAAIFEYVRSLGYESYKGSLRGARGTLWSAAANAMDQASLLIALLRASGIPAAYRHGSLDDALAQELILSMFPAAQGIAGYVPEGDSVADPANDPQLLEESRDHWWVEAYLPGDGWTHLDPSFSRAQIGESFVPAPEPARLVQVPDSLRHKVTLKVEIETYHVFSALYSDGLLHTYPLTHTFNSVELVGNPVSLGHLVDTTYRGGLISAYTQRTYVPSFTVGDQIIEGEPFDDFMSSLFGPLINYFTTGEWLVFEMRDTEGNVETSRREIADLLGFENRQAGGVIQFGFDLTEMPSIVNEQSLYTTLIAPSEVPASAINASYQQLVEGFSEGEAAMSEIQALIDSGGPAEEDLPRMREAKTTLEQAVRLGHRTRLLNFAAASDLGAERLGRSLLVKPYYDSPRILIISGERDTANETNTIMFDLHRDTIRTVAYPGQSLVGVQTFNFVRGLAEMTLEANLLQGFAPEPVISVHTVLQQALAQGVSLVMITPANLVDLANLDISEEAKARIVAELRASPSKFVIVPASSVTIGAKTTIGWLLVDVITGETIDVMENGQHIAAISYGLILNGSIQELAFGIIGVGHGFAAYTFAFLGSIMGMMPFTAVDLKTAWTLALAEASSYTDLIAAILAPAAAKNKWIAAYLTGFKEGVKFAKTLIDSYVDPPLPSALFMRLRQPPNVPVLAVGSVLAAATSADTVVEASLALANFSATGDLSSSWSSEAQYALAFEQLDAAGVTLYAEDGALLDSGTASARPAKDLAWALTAATPATLAASGEESISFYAPALTGLAAGTHWITGAAQLTPTQPYTLTLQGSLVTMNGANTYIGDLTLVTPESITIQGVGPTAAPHFAGSTTLQASGANLQFGPATLLSGSLPFSTANGAALAGYTGDIAIAEATSSTDQVELTGNASFFTLDLSPAATTTDPNTPLTFQAAISANFNDTYTLTVEAPPGWELKVGESGLITATPPLGAAPGDYSLLVTAQSGAYPDLFVSAVHTVTTVAHQGVSLGVNPDLQFTIPWGPADPHAAPGSTNNGQIQLPDAAFSIDITNTSTVSHTFEVLVTGLSSNWLIFGGSEGQTATALTLPAGGIGQVGLYISPTLPLPAAGTPYAFEVTATAVDDPALSQSGGETFIVPAIAFNYLVVTPPVIYASPHTTATFDIALTNVGNVTGNFPLNVTLPVSTWVQISTLQSPISLSAGETQMQSVSLAIPGATLGRSYAVCVNSPAPGTPYTQTASVNVQIVSANTLPIYQAAEEAAELFPGDLSLPAALNFLGQAISDLDSSCQDGACGLDLRDRVVSGARAVANHAEPVLALVTADESLRQIAAAMATHTDAADLLADTDAIRDAVETLLVKLQAVAHHSLKASFTPGLVAALDDGSAPAEYVLHVTNEGRLATTAVMTLTPPAGASASWANRSVSLQPGELVTVATLITATTQGIFTVQADVAAAEAALISRQAQAHLAVVDTFLQIGNVIATPTFVEYQSGLAVPVYADVSNLINLPIAGNARLQAVAADGTQVYSGTTPVVVASSIAPLRINLGCIDTAGLVTGTYTLTVSIFDEGGAVIPEATGQGILAIGQAVEASSRVSPEVVAPGDATVETIIDTELSDDVLDLGGGKLLYKLAQLPITGTAVSLVVSGVPTLTVAGTSYPLTMIAYDIFGNVAISYTGTITFTNSDPQATLPVTYTFVESDGGQHTFPIIFGTPGEQSVSVTDVDDPTLTDTLVTNVSVGPVDVNNTQLSASSLHHADGIEASVIVITATDSFNNGIPGAIVWVRPSGTENHVRDYPGTTDANGVFTTTLTSTKPEYKVLNVLVGDGQTMRWLPSPLLIEFTGAIITGTVFSDPNRDNVQQPGESGLGGVQARLYRGAETTPLKQTVTQSDGRYSFTGLVSGAYRVEQTRLGEYAFSDSGVLTVTVNDFATIANIDFGNYDAAQATGRVWNDGNQDGLRQAGEPGLPGVTMSLYDTNNQLVDSTTTDASGNYRFDLIADLPAAPSNFTFSSGRFRLQEPAAAVASNVDFSFTRIPLDSSTYPVNYDFTNSRITLLTSTYPLNYDFTDGRTALPTTTYPANYDFLSGDFGGWTPSDPVYVQVISSTSNLDGPHLWIGRYNHWAESTTFTVPTGTQSVRFNYQNYGRDSNRGANVYVYARSGPDFSTSTSLGGFSGTSAQGWLQAVADLQAFQGQSIKLRFVTGNDSYDNDRSRIDNIGLYIETPDWKPATTSHGYVRIISSTANLDGPHLWIGRYNHWAESTAFTVPAGTQSVRFNYHNYGRSSTRGANVHVYARSGPGFSTSTSLGGFSGTSAQGWLEATADLQAFQGQSIKLRFITGNDSYDNDRSRIDNIGLYIETPDWKPATTSHGYVRIISSTANLDGPHLWIGRYNHWAESASFTVPAGTQSLRFNYQNYGRSSTRGANVHVYARSGPNFSTSTSLGGFSGTSDQGWLQAVADLQAFQGQTIKLRFITGNDSYDNDRSRIDNIGLYVETPDWKPATTSHGYVRIISSTANLDGPHLWIGRYNHWADSAPFTVPAGTQSVRFNYQNYGRGSTRGAYVYVYARSGPGFSTSTSLGGFSGTSAQGWLQAVADLQAFQEQTIKLRFVTGNDSYDNDRSRIDNVGLYVETPDWKPSTTSHGYVQIVNNPANLDGPHLWIGRYNHWAESAPFAVPTETQSVRFNYQNYGRGSTRGAYVYVYARSGPDFSTSTSLGGFSGTSSQGWRQATANLQAFQGQTIKLRFVTGNDSYDNDRSRIDNVYLLPLSTTPYTITEINLPNHTSTTPDTVSVDAYGGAAFNIDFGDFSVDRFNSTVQVSPTVLVADGVSTAVVTVTLHDNSNNPLPGYTVEISAPGTGVTVTQSLNPTNASGQAVGTIRATCAPQNVLVAARSVSDNTTLDQSVPITIIPGPPDVEHFTFVAAPTKVVANGVDAALFTVTLRDQYDNPTSGRPVTITHAGTAIGLTLDFTQTNVLGQVTGNVRSTVVQTVTLQAHTDGFTLTQVITLGFVPGQADPTNSTITILPATVLADGVQTAAITATLRDALGRPVPGRLVELVVDGSANTITPAGQAQTDAGGVIVFSLASSAAEAKQVSVRDVDYGVTLPAGQVDFVPGPTDVDASQLAADKTTVVADDEDSATVTATLLDSFGHPLSGKTLLIQATGSDITLAQPDTVTDGQGQVRATISSSLVQDVIVTALDQTSDLTLTQSVTLSFVSLYYAPSLTPAEAVDSGGGGITVTYNLYLENAGNTSDIFTLTSSGHTWPTAVPASVGPLAPGAGENVPVTVIVPLGTAPGISDTVAIIATSMANPSSTATSRLNTYAVDVAVQICLAFDGSGSISGNEFTLMKNGLANAIRDGSVMPQDGSVEISIVQFANSGARIEVGTTVIVDGAMAENVASQVEAIGQIGRGTPIYAGINLCTSLIVNSQHFAAASKQVINLPTDGEPTVGYPNPQTAALTSRNNAVAAGIDQVNAEAIGVTDSGVAFLRDQLVYPQPGYEAPPFVPDRGGFVIRVTDFTEFADSIKQKLKFVSAVGPSYFLNVEHNVPVTGTEVLTDTFAPLPQATLFGTEQVQIDWAHVLTVGHTFQQDRFEITLPDMRPGETRQVASGTVVSYTGPSGSGSIQLPPLYVTAWHLVAVEPAAQTVSPGTRAVYQVSLYNPGTTESTLTLAVAGLPAGWVDLVDTVSLAAGEQVILPLTVTVPAAEDALGEYPFAVVVETNTGGRDQAGALLIVAGAPSQFEVAVTPEMGYVANGEALTYTITLTNLEAVPQTYALSLAGLENSPATLPAMVTVAANSTVTAPLKVTAYASHGPHPFAVTATAIDTNVSHADDAVLVVVGDRRVAADLSPSAATGGPGVPVPYTLTVINKGSLPDTYAISVNSPAGWSYQLEANGQAVNSLSLTPYLFNVADLVLLVTPAATATPGDYTFTVSVQSQNNPNVSASVAGTLTVIEYGVQVELLPDSLVMSPAGTGTWQVLVTNTGAVLDTYDLTAGGIISNSAQFSPDTIALAPGQSQTVQLTAGDMTFALPRTYPIKVTARSLFDNRIQNHDTANLTFTGYEAVEVGWIPDSRVLTDTLEATYMLLITNTGNVATVYDLSVGAPLPGVEVEVEQVYIPPHMTVGVLVRVRAAEAGTYLITGQADSTTGAASGSGTATLIVEDSAASRPPNALADTAVTLEDTPVTISVLANDTDPDGDPLTVISITLPLSGTAVINPDGTLTYAPTADFYGTDNFSYTISDDHGRTATAAVTVTVTPINDAPLALDDAVTTDEDTPVTIDVLSNDSDADGDSLTLDGVTQATNGTTVVNPDGTLIYTPTVDFYGTDNFSYTISDSHGSTATATISLNVTPVNDIPVAADDTVTTDEDTPVTIDVLANDTDADSDSLTVISTTPPLNGALIINPDNTLIYTPVADFHGTDSFTYTVDDGHGGAATATVTVSVTSINDAPLALDDAVTTDEDTPVTIDVLANDSDADGDSLALDAVSQAVNGTISVNLDSTLTYTPTADFYGTDSFTYTISDGHGGVATAMVSITVSPVNDVPVAVDDSVTAIENITLTIDVLANDTDRDGDSLGVSAVTQATHGTVTINPDNTLAYTSAPGFYGGTDTFTYTINDSNGGTDMAMVVVTVVPAGNCGELYPIAMHVDLLADVNMGDYIDDVYSGVQPGNFGWMSWTGDPSEGALVIALTPPGNSSDYVNPYDPSDHIVSVGDWVPGMPGVSNSNGVRAALDGLMVMDITIPVWDLSEDTGNNTHYRIVDFAVVRIPDYYLPNENRISVRFMGFAALCREIP